MIQKGAGVNESINDGWTFLYIASQNGHFKMVEYLILCSADLNIRSDSDLISAEVVYNNNHDEIVEYLNSANELLRKKLDKVLYDLVVRDEETYKVDKDYGICWLKFNFEDNDMINRFPDCDCKFYCHLEYLQDWFIGNKNTPCFCKEGINLGLQSRFE